MKLSRIISIMLCAVILVGVVGFAVPAYAVSNTAIGSSDFEIKIGKTKVNLATCIAQDVAKAAKKKIARSKNEGIAKTTEGTFTFQNTSASSAEFDTFVAAVLSKKAVTSRGIKLGSTRAKLLEAYPEPVESWSDKNAYYYRFCAAKTFEEWYALEQNSVEERVARLAICITVSKRTNKVNKIEFRRYWG